MITKAIKIPLAAMAVGLLGFSAVYAPPSAAAGFGDMFSPGKWFGGGRDRDRYYDDDYGYGGPGRWGGPGWGGGPYGGGPYGGGPYGGYPGAGWGYPGAGWGYPGYGYGAPTYQAPAAPAQAAPSTGSTASKPSASSKRIEELERRIQELESQKTPPQAAPPSSSEWPSAPAFRPMSKY